MAYLDDILTLSPSHVYTFDNTLTDVVAGNPTTNSGTDFTNNPICKDSSRALRTNSVTDRLGVSLTDAISGSQGRKAVCGWISLSEIQRPPKTIYREGIDGNQFAFVCWAGNNLMLDIVDGTEVYQAFSNNVLVPDRPYHIYARYERATQGNKIELFIDGVKQSATIPENGQPNGDRLSERTSIQFGGESGSTEVGGSTVKLNAPVNGKYSYWCFFDSTSVSDMSETDIRETLFEKGAIPLDGITITTDTQANMQAQLDALSSSVLPNRVMDIQVQPVSGGGNLTLSADNIVHDPLSSINVQYTATSGSLTWINLNGSNASIISAPFGASISVVTPALLSLSPLVSGTEVRIYESGTETELAGIENSGTSFSATINTSSVDVVVHKEDYEYIRIDGVDLTNGDINIPINQIFDRNYNNP